MIVLMEAGPANNGMAMGVTAREMAVPFCSPAN